MSETTPFQNLPLIAAAQAQKHITHNEALALLDAMVHLRVESADIATPPGEPFEGERHIIGAMGSGAFAGRADEIASFEGGVWRFLVPREGWLAWVAAEQALLVFHEGQWQAVSTGGAGEATATLGVNAIADATNRIAVSSPASLFDFEVNDHRLKINKATETDTASLLFQTDYSGRAEFGLAGSDGFSIKVSAEGTDWNEAMVVDPATGEVSFPNTSFAGAHGPAAPPAPNLLINPDFRLNQRAFAGGSLSAGTYGFDRWKAGASGADLARSGGVVSLASGSVLQIIEPSVFGHDSVAGETLTVSLDHLSGAAITISAFGTDEVVDEVGGRPSASFAIPGGHTDNISLEIKAPSGSAGFARVKAEIGASPTPFTHRPLQEEEILAARYYKRIEGPFALFLYAQAYGNYFFNSLPTPVTMRTTPMVTRTLGTYGNIFGGDPGNAMASGLSPTAFRLSVRANGSGECYANFNAVMLDAEL